MAALALGLPLLGGPGEAQAALTVTITKSLIMGICEKLAGPVVVLPNSAASQSNQCGAQNAGIVRITGGTANQLVTLTLPAGNRTLTKAASPNITVHLFTFSTSAGQTFNTNTGSFRLDGAGTMTVYVGCTTNAAIPAGAGTGTPPYAGTARVTVV